METPNERMARLVAWEVESCKSFEARIHHDCVDHTPGGQLSGTIDDYFVALGTDRARWDQWLHAPKGDRLYVSYRDGHRFARETFKGGPGSRQVQVVVQRSFGSEGELGGTDRPLPLKYFLVGTEPLQKALLQAIPQGKTALLGRDCEIFLFPQARWLSTPLDLIYVIDQQTGVPLEVRCYRDSEARQAGRPLWSWVAESLDEVQGHHLPLRSVESNFEPTGSGAEPALWLTRRLTITDVRYDREQPASRFWPVIQPGTSVWDKVARTHYVQPGPDGRPPAEPVVAHPVRAEPPSSWTPVASWAAIGLGVAVLAVGLLLARRGR